MPQSLARLPISGAHPSVKYFCSRVRECQSGQTTHSFYFLVNFGRIRMKLESVNRLADKRAIAILGISHQSVCARRPPCPAPDAAPCPRPCFCWSQTSSWRSASAISAFGFVIGGGGGPAAAAQISDQPLLHPADMTASRVGQSGSSCASLGCCSRRNFPSQRSAHGRMGAAPGSHLPAAASDSLCRSCVQIMFSTVAKAQTTELWMWKMEVIFAPEPSM